MSSDRRSPLIIATNIELVTFEEFQHAYFDKWIGKRIWAIEEQLDGFQTYYEPFVPPGYSSLTSDEDRAAYAKFGIVIFLPALCCIPSLHTCGWTRTQERRKSLPSITGFAASFDRRPALSVVPTAAMMPMPCSS